MGKIKDILIGEEDTANDNTLETIEERRLIKQVQLNLPRYVAVLIEDKEPEVSTEDCGHSDREEREESLNRFAISRMPVWKRIQLGLLDGIDQEGEE